MLFDNMTTAGPVEPMVKLVEASKWSNVVPAGSVWVIWVFCESLGPLLCDRFSISGEK